MTLPIIQLGNPILRQKASLVENIKSDEIQKLIDDLITTVVSANGVGIAAPQVAQQYRLFIMASRPNPRYPNAPEMEPTPMLNPTIIAHSNELVKGWEGCLSVPGIRGFVPRYQYIEVEYLDRNGKHQKKQFSDFLARIFQHEYDHFDGIVYLDRLENTLDIITELEYQNRIVNNT
ncbi:MAG: peptide deformylase [Scytonematopsis contorta HA4267-MV1]|jgi:peptide deformylase|nr:peptide deformylase [Scytonematopsis contorta HA4267-MV1]